MCNEIINVTNNIPKNVTSTVSINSNDKEVRHKINCWILHTVLIVIILLFIIAIICYHYLKHRPKQTHFGVLTI